MIKRHIGTFLGAALNQLLWPATCVNCGSQIGENDAGLCRQCWQSLMFCMGGDYCQRCGKNASSFGIVGGVCPKCQGTQPIFDGIARVGIYDESLQKMIISFKNGKTELRKMLADMSLSALQGSFFRKRFDFFVPVPLHWTRRLARGYNQAHILAKELSDGNMEVNTDLVRIRRTKFQPAMASAAARARNVAGAFAVRRHHKFNGRRICLVDDIKTTGATLNECAKTLKQSGASAVYAVVVAVAAQKPY